MFVPSVLSPIQLYFRLVDEAAEFSRVALDALRQPLESGSIEVSRTGFTARFPARFQLVMAMNPCPCGNYGVRGSECTCPSIAIRRYAARLSGPLRDRLDIELHVSRIATSDAVSDAASRTTSAEARQRVVSARERAAARWRGTPWSRNADVPGARLRQADVRVGADARAPLDRALEKGLITLRGYDRVLRVAWTMADLDDCERPGRDQIGRALFMKRGYAA
ncbi:ATP-binding protein [Microbacterium sp. NPDC089695]|uniref:ATP-binding protein n=1 Tax=Microbacterium sp. NPDC089695 TaxID=3364198 RepID=UPI0037FC9F9A